MTDAPELQLTLHGVLLNDMGINRNMIKELIWREEKSQ